MKTIVFLLFFLAIQTEDKTRIFKYNGSDVKTSYGVDNSFYGTYKGRKKGFLLLNKDGTGEYSYDVFAFGLPGCTPEPIKFEWGFLLDDGKIVSFERSYGLSYPILFKSISDNSFKGCREEMMLDFIIRKNDGKLGVSSSDDWVKEVN